MIVDEAGYESCVYADRGEDDEPCVTCCYRYMSRYKRATCAECFHREVCKFRGKDDKICEYFAGEEDHRHGAWSDSDDD